MNPRRLLFAAAVTTAAAVFVTAPSVHALDLEFGATCTGQDIVDSTPGCGWSAIDVTVDGNGNVGFVQVTTYPRAAFDDLLVNFEMWEGTTEEYMEASFDGVSEPGVTYDWAVEPDHVAFTVDLALSRAGGDAAFLGFTVEDDQIVAAIEPSIIAGVDRLTVTIPGRIAESSGSVAGNVATWDSQAVASAGMLTVRGPLTPDDAGLSWVVWLLPAGGAIMLAGAIVGLGARRRMAKI